MRIKNYTKFSTELIREIIAFVKPNGVSNFDISFKNSENGWKGKAYYAGCSYHERSLGRRGKRTSARVAYVTIGVPIRFIHDLKTGETGKAYITEKTRYRRPNVTNYGQGYLRSVQFSPVEDMVHLIAHELRHLWQAKVKKGHRVWGSRGQFSERDADAYAIRMTRAWRRSTHATVPTTVTSF